MKRETYVTFVNIDLFYKYVPHESILLLLIIPSGLSHILKVFKKSCRRNFFFPRIYFYDASVYMVVNPHIFTQVHISFLPL
jgi:hypothetical protein